MSPRSAEFLEEARECLAAADALLERGLATRSVHESYYAMLYAARAALSERDETARTHRGTWHLFRATFVEPHGFDVRLYQCAHQAQTMREGADYDAADVSDREAEDTYRNASGFVEAVEALLAD